MCVSLIPDTGVLDIISLSVHLYFQSFRFSKFSAVSAPRIDVCLQGLSKRTSCDTTRETVRSNNSCGRRSRGQKDNITGHRMMKARNIFIPRFIILRKNERAGLRSRIRVVMRVIMSTIALSLASAFLIIYVRTSPRILFSSHREKNYMNDFGPRCMVGTLGRFLPPLPHHPTDPKLGKGAREGEE